MRQKGKIINLNINIEKRINEGKFKSNANGAKHPEVQQADFLSNVPLNQVRVSIPLFIKQAFTEVDLTGYCKFGGQKKKLLTLKQHLVYPEDRNAHPVRSFITEKMAFSGNSYKGSSQLNQRM